MLPVALLQFVAWLLTGFVICALHGFRHSGPGCERRERMRVRLVGTP